MALNNKSRIGQLVLTISEQDVLHVGDTAIQFIRIGRGRIQVKCVGPVSIPILRDKVLNKRKDHDSENNDAE